MAKKEKPLQVKATKIGRLDVFGITDGEKWFWWGYVDEASAHKMLWNILAGSPLQRSVNIVHDKAYKVSTLAPTEIKIQE